MRVVAVILAIALNVSLARADSVAAQVNIFNISAISSSSHVGTSLADKNKTVRKNAELALKYTRTKAGRVVFDKKAALKHGMLKAFAAKYASYLVVVEKRIDSIRAMAVQGWVRTVPHGILAHGWDVVGCVIAMVGLVVAAVTLCLAVAATFGVAALAFIGYLVAGVAAVKDCYL